MRALAHLISLNKPELVLFVGEALVGNDAIDQLTKFNQVIAFEICIFHRTHVCLSCPCSRLQRKPLRGVLCALWQQRLTDLADSQDARTRAIDGIVLTKFDTIDDKVCLGCALPRHFPLHPNATRSHCWRITLLCTGGCRYFHGVHQRCSSDVCRLRPNIRRSETPEYKGGGQQSPWVKMDQTGSDMYHLPEATPAACSLCGLPSKSRLPL